MGMTEDPSNHRWLAQAELEDPAAELATKRGAANANALLLQDGADGRPDASAVLPGQFPQPLKHWLVAASVRIKLELELMSAHSVKG